MKKSLLICGIITLSFISSSGQDQLSAEKAGQLKKIAKDAKGTSSDRLTALESLIKAEAISQVKDTLLFYGNLTLELAKKAKNNDLQSAGLNMLGISYAQEENLDKADSCYRLSEKLLSKDSDPIFIAGSLINRGILLSKKGLNSQAIALYTEAIEIATNNNLLRTRVAAETNLATLLARQGDIASAVEYFTNSLTSYEKLNDSSGIGNCLSNIGSCNQMMGELEKSHVYFHKAALIFKKINHPNLPRPLLNLGSTYTAIDRDSLNKYTDMAIEAANAIGDYSMVAAAYIVKAQDFGSGDLDEAERCLITAMNFASKANNPSQVGEIKTRMSQVKGLKGDHRGAIKIAEEALAIGEELNDNPIQSNALISLVAQYKALGMHEKALEYYERQIKLEAELNNQQNERQLIRQEYAYDYQKQALADSLTFAAEKELQLKEIERQKMMRNGFMGGFFLVGGFAAVFFYQRKRIAKEKQRSEDLLLNILPEEIAQELKIKGKADARDFDMVAILFTDFKDFTTQSAKLSASLLVSEINYCFEAFDGIMDKYNVEKIKTIGDSYMAAGGLPVPTANSIKNTILAALDMQAFILARKAEKGEFAFEMRVGIHAGPVVAGIVGVKKFQYDIWGDTVNTASRMESSGEVGKVNISQSTYEMIKNEPEFAFEPRGKVAVKGKGEMEMWFVSLEK